MRIGAAPISVADFVAACDGPVVAELTEAAWARIAAARVVVERHAAGDVPVYGLNTGLGGNLAHRVAPGEIAAFQAQILAGRSVGIGPVLAEGVSRGALLARLIGAAQGAAGVSPGVVRQMADMLARGLAPVIAARGSIGAGDLVLAAQMGACLTGAGELWLGGVRRPAGEALAAVGLAPVTLGPKDALALANHSCITLAQAALLVVRAERAMTLARGVATLAGEGYGMNLAIFDPRLQDLRPAAGQARAAAWFRAGFAGSSLAGAARAIQDPLSFRTLAPVFGAAAWALAGLGQEVAVELNGASDSPAVLGDTILSTANFHTPGLALALDALAIAHVHLATASAQRMVKLMAPQLTGLAKYLSPIGGASAGYVPLQKTAAALLGEIRLAATPASLDAMVVSEMVEDVAPQTPLAAMKLGTQLDAMAWLVSLEALVAAQAADLRGGTLGRAGALLHRAVRGAAPALAEDRAGTLDLAALGPALAAPALATALAGIGEAGA